MSRIGWFAAQTALSLLLACGLFAALGAKADDRGATGPRASLGSAFTYQGQLRDANGPVDGSCDFTFALFDVESGGAPLATDSSTLNVDAGLFAALIDFGDSAFTGQARWIEVTVDCGAGPEALARQPIGVAPYAHSLRPGAVVRGAHAGSTLTLENTGTGPGLFAKSASSGTPDIVLGGNGPSPADTGRLSSDPALPSSDLVLQANDSVVARTGVDPAETGEFQVQDRDGTVLFQAGAGGLAQPFSAFGLPKALVVVSGCGGIQPPTIARSFTTYAGAPITVSDWGSGRCLVDFGFNVQSRYIVLQGRPLGSDAIYTSYFFSSPEVIRIQSNIDKQTIQTSEVTIVVY